MEARVTFFVVGLNHKTAPVELREQLAVSPSNLVGRTAELKLRDDLDEIVLLSETHCSFATRIAVRRAA